MTGSSGDRSPLRAFAAGVRRGLAVLAIVAGVAEALAIVVWAVGGTGISLATALSLGGLELGAIHHVAIRLEIRDLVTAASGRIDVTVGVALLSVTLVAGWLLARSVVRGARDLDVTSAGAGLRLGATIALGAGVTLGYAVPLAIGLPFVRVETAPSTPTATTGVFGFSLIGWQGVVFPVLIAAIAAAAGVAWVSRRRRRRADEVAASDDPGAFDAVLVGAGRMLAVAFVLAFVGLFVGGVVVPDGAIALATPTTARYVRALEGRPVAGAVIAVHHLAVAPAEATWVIVPAMGGCVRAWGSIEGDLLCYGRFPTALSPEEGEESLATPVGAVAFDGAPPAYLLFVLVPAIATLLGGVRAGAFARTASSAAARGALAGVAFGCSVCLAAMASVVTVTTASDVSGTVSRNAFSVGPDPVAALVLGLAWGVGGGAVGGVVSRRARSRARTARTAPG